MFTNGTFTIENRETGEWRTFRIEEAKFAPGKQMLSLLIGASNSHDYRGFAFVNGDTVNVWQSRKAEAYERSNFEKLGKFVQEFLRLNADPGRTMSEEGALSRYQMLDACPCARCGELLTVPESIRRGLGPVCARHP